MFEARQGQEARKAGRNTAAGYRNATKAWKGRVVILMMRVRMQPGSITNECGEDVPGTGTLLYASFPSFYSSREETQNLSNPYLVYLLLFVHSSHMLALDVLE
jgi:hypothetical protein